MGFRLTAAAEAASVFRVCVGAPAGVGCCFQDPTSRSCLQVDGKRYPSSEDGIQVVVIDGSQGRVVSHASFRNAILQGIPWQVFNYVAAIPDK